MWTVPLSHVDSPAVTCGQSGCHTRTVPLSHVDSPAVTCGQSRCHMWTVPLSHVDIHTDEEASRAFCYLRERA
jgi:hypothetical protein